MTRIGINLLPHREEKRKLRRGQFYVVVVAVAAVAFLIVFVGSQVFNHWIDYQQAQNTYLKAQNDKLDKDIEQIKELKEQVLALTERAKIIESLQKDRAESVLLLAELVKQVPDGVYLKEIKQVGNTVNLFGYAQSNPRVSVLMENLRPFAGSAPVLIETKVVSLNRKTLLEFSMYFTMEQSATKGEGADAKKPAGKNQPKGGGKA
ncbi:MAG: PilN domain-containing protein [Betaproteobacteria bacterium]|nr:PilN domain-containing protein [Betaproteobacteria bacterium]